MNLFSNIPIRFTVFYAKTFYSNFLVNLQNLCIILIEKKRNFYETRRYILDVNLKSEKYSC